MGVPECEKTPLHYAVSNDLTAIALELICYGANPSWRDNACKTLWNLHMMGPTMRWLSVPADGGVS